MSSRGQPRATARSCKAYKQCYKQSIARIDSSAKVIPMSRTNPDLFDDPELEPEHLAAANKVLGTLDIAEHARSFRYLIGSWKRTVAEVERGYSDTVDEYLNDVSSRAILQRVIERVPPATRERLVELVSPVDERFRAVTVASRALEIYFRFNPETEWWYARIPLNPGQWLGEDISWAERKLMACGECDPS